MRSNGRYLVALWVAGGMSAACAALVVLSWLFRGDEVELRDLAPVLFWTPLLGLLGGTISLATEGKAIAGTLVTGCLISGCAFLLLGVFLDLWAPSMVPLLLALVLWGAMLGLIVGAMTLAARVGILRRVFTLGAIGIGLALLLVVGAKVLDWR